ncbi:MAG: signal peptidase I [Firmicutes bacterium]|uniref:Signal peptidase I n=1 Tax=Melghirimyces thermohalophilus TaxID=1236220 RepID=A0A1G6NLI3_9BACL|nr:signal peptidase I [Melghirimyces thermohalophilus]MDA8352294.1 signal peptidase I [Bacillota bacterium]SDC68136.1 signal peptidase I [Melghirimyces thermohalophilus]
MSEFTPRSAKHGRRRRRGNDEAWEWVQALAVAVVLALIIRYFIFSPFSVSGPSMMSTLHNNDLVIVNKVLYMFRDPKPGEVIVFHATEEKDYIKRVIALPGQTVSAYNNVVRVNGESIEEPYIDEGNRTADFGPVKVPEGHVFVMGDNRMNSSDSRNPEVGPVPIDHVVGRADVIFWPLKDFQVLW